MILRTHSIVIIKRAWTHSTHTLRIQALWCHWQGSNGLGNSLKFTVHRELGLHCLLYDAFKRRAKLGNLDPGPLPLWRGNDPKGIPCPLTRMAIFLAGRFLFAVEKPALETLRGLELSGPWTATVQVKLATWLPIYLSTNCLNQTCPESLEPNRLTSWFLMAQTWHVWSR